MPDGKRLIDMVHELLASLEDEPLMLTTTEAATKLGLTARRLRQLIQQGALPASKHGRDWLIAEAGLHHVEARPAVGWPKGRPRKAAE